MSLVKLVYSDANGWEKFVELNEINNVVMIGRNPECAVSTNNASVSRVHAMVTWRDGKLFVSDPPNSRPTNGTKVDGMRLQAGEVLELFIGSELVCGNYSIKVVSDGVGESVPRMGEQAPNMSGAPSPQMYQQGGYNNARSNYGMVSNPPVRQNYAPDNRNNGNRMPMQQPQQPVSMPQPVVMSQPVQVSQPVVMPQQAAQPVISQVSSVVDNGRNKRQRAPYTPAHSQINSGNMPIPDDVLRLQEENAQLRRELDEAHSGSSSTDDSVRELQEKLDERDQILSDYERRDEYHETVEASLKEMIDKLKDQLDHQKEQYQECRRDLVTAQDEAESLQMELTTLKENLESKGMATSNAEMAIADLKVQLSQKNRQLADLQRELDLAQYSYKEEQENVARLKENVDTLNEALSESQRRNADMEKVVEQHEVMFSELKGNLNDRAREIRQLQDSLRAKGGSDSAALMQEMSQLRDTLNRKSGELELIQKQLKNAEEAASSNAVSQKEVESLRERIRELESAAGKESVEAGGQITSLRRQLEELSAENESLRKAGGEGGGIDNELLERIRGLYSDMNDVVSQWREDLEMLDSSITDLQRVFVAYVKIDVSKLIAPDKARLEKVLKDYDPKIIFEDIGNSLDAGQNSLMEIKEKLKDLRGALQM